MSTISTANSPPHSPEPWWSKRPLDFELALAITATLGPLPPIDLLRGRLADFACRCLGAGAFVVGRTIVLARDSERCLVHYPAQGALLLLHEAVHVRQYAACGTLYFLASYATAYVRGRFAGLTHDQAYRAIPAEAEAFAIEARGFAGATPAPRPSN